MKTCLALMFLISLLSSCTPLPQSSNSYYDDRVPVKEKAVEIPVEKSEKKVRVPERFLQ